MTRTARGWPGPCARPGRSPSSTRRSPRCASTRTTPSPGPSPPTTPRTVSVGSSSKSHWGGLRTGWIRAPHSVLPGLVESRVTTDLGAPVLEQLVLLELMRASPGLTDERRADLRAGRDALVTGLRTPCPTSPSPSPSAACRCGASSPTASTPPPSRSPPRTRDSSSPPVPASPSRAASTGGCACPTCWTRRRYTSAAERLARAVATVAGGRGGRVSADRGRPPARPSRPLVA